MSTNLSGASVGVHLHVSDTKIVHHANHDDDRASYRIVGDDAGQWNVPAVYLAGTAEELLAFAQRLKAAVLTTEANERKAQR